MDLLISEILEKVSKVKSKKEKVAFLKENVSDNFHYPKGRHWFLLLAFACACIVSNWGAVIQITGGQLSR